MRVTASLAHLEVEPGSRASVAVDVVNTSDVIDGVSAEVVGLHVDRINAEPAMLPLFPESGGQLTVSLETPATMPAGRHPFVVEVVSHGNAAQAQSVDLDLLVAARPRLAVAATKRIVRARRETKSVLEVRNPGNVPLDVDLKATDPDRVVTTTLSPARVRVEPGTTVPVVLRLRGPRMITGGEIDRSVTAVATARPVAPAADDATDPAAGDDTLSQETTVRLRQRPLLSRGLLTALVLAGIVALWAAAFLLGITKLFADDPATKVAPASFFAAAKTVRPAAFDGTTPDGMLPRTAQLPPGVGGVISGRVTAKSNGTPVGRILVTAERRKAGGALVEVGTAATQADGTYAFGGLFPTSYYIVFSAAGYDGVVYPAATDVRRGRLVDAGAQGVTTGVDAVITGRPAIIRGRVDPAAGEKAEPVTVAARSLTSGKVVATSRTRTTSGEYQLRNLPAPDTYAVTFVAKGYVASSATEQVAGGETRQRSPMTLGAAPAAVHGLVRDSGNDGPLDGVTVTTVAAGHVVATVTPTTGAVGSFVLPDLPTPGTYVVRFEKPGYGTRAKIVHLVAGKPVRVADTGLLTGAGAVSGTVRNAAGELLGGVSVTLGGISGPAPTTTTLTEGSVGFYSLDGVPAGGDFTLTFHRAGFQTVTIPIHLRGGPATDVRAVLPADSGRIAGRICGAADGADVTVTNGVRNWTLTSSSGIRKSTFAIDRLLAGSYAVTAAADGHRLTRYAVVRPGRTTKISLDLTRKCGS